MSEPWEGTRKCLFRDCRNREIEGLSYCLGHVPDQDLAEAEAVTGLRRCRARMPRPCTGIATAASDPPLCPRHVSEGIVTKKASPGFIESDMSGLLADILAEHGEKLLNAQPITDPLDALQRLAGEMEALLALLRIRVGSIPMEQWRYEHGRVGEQIRTEVFLYERAMDRLGKHLVNIAKLHIEEHRATLDAEVIQFCTRAFGMALEASGADISGQQRAREVLGRELQKITA